MRKIISILILLIFSVSSYSATYYIKNAGNDTNTGLSDAQAWTYERLKTFVPAVGDHILFHRGETFEGMLMLGRSSTLANPVVYGAYGAGSDPVITTMKTLSGWTLHSGKIYKVTGVPANCDVVTIDGTSVSMGKYPQNGENTFESQTMTSRNISKTIDYSGTVSGTILFTTSTSHGLTTGNMVTIRNTSSYDGYYSATVVASNTFYITKSFVSDQTGTLLYNTSITDNQLTGSPNWTNAEVVIWKSNWTIDRGNISNHSTSTLTYVSGSSYAVQASGGQKYYIQRSISACTYQGAWYCDGTSFYMYFDNNDPNNFVVKAGVSDYTVFFASKNYNTIRDLEIQGGNLAGIFCTTSTGFNFRNSTLKNTGLLGLTASLSTATTIDSCDISYVNGTGISINSAGSYIGHSTITYCGKFAGMGGASGGSHYGIYTKGVGNITELNQINNIGYIPIYWESSSAVCRYNIVHTYPTLLLNDGGGIYTFESATPQIAKKCYGNVIYNSTANGLYSDGIANNIEFYGNTVVNMGKWSIHMNEPFNNIVHDNTFYGFGLAAIDVSNQYFMGSPAAANNSVYSNLIIQSNGSHVVYSLQDSNTSNAILNFGSSNNNTFIVDNSATNIFFNQRGSASSLPFSALYYNFANWKTLSSKELSSTYTTKDLNTLTFLYNETQSLKTVAISGAKIDLYGNTYSGSIDLPPYTSILLLPTVIPPAPITPGSGIKNSSSKGIYIKIGGVKKLITI